MSTPRFSEAELRREVDALDAWRNRLHWMAVHLGETDYDEDTGEPLNRAAEVESVLNVVLDDLEQALAALRRITKAPPA